MFSRATWKFRCVCMRCLPCHPQDKCYYLFLMYEACRHNVECTRASGEKMIIYFPWKVNPSFTMNIPTHTCAYINLNLRATFFYAILTRNRRIAEYIISLVKLTNFANLVSKCNFSFWLILNGNFADVNHVTWCCK